MKTDETLVAAYQRHKEKIVKEQCALLHTSTPLPLLFLLINAILLVAIWWPFAPGQTLLTWISIIILLSGVRGWLYVAYRKADPETINHVKWSYTYIFLITLVSITWGSTAIILFPEDAITGSQWLEYELLLAFILATNAAIAVPSMQYMRAPARVFTVLTLLPICARFILLGSSQSDIFIGVLGLLFTFVTLINAEINYRKSLQNLLLRIERESMGNTQSLLENAHEGIFVTVDGVHVHANKIMHEMLGYEEGELIGTHIEDIVHPEELDSVIQKYQLRHSDGATPQHQYETAFVTKDGEKLPFEITVSQATWEGKQAITVFARDITERLKNRKKLKAVHDELERRVLLRTEKLQQEINSHKLTEQTLYKSEQRINAVLNTAVDAIITFDENCIINSVNYSAEEMFEYSQHELIGMDMDNLIAKDKSLNKSIPISKQLTSEQSLTLGERRQHFGVKKNNETFPIDIVISDFVMDNKRFFSSIIRDTTESLWIQKELENSKARLSHLLTSTPVVIYTCKANQNYDTTFVSDNIVEMTGHYPHEFISDPSFWRTQVHNEDRETVFSDIQALFENGRHEREYRFKKSDGKYIWIRDELKLTYNEKGEPSEIVGYLADINAKKEAEVKINEARIEAERANKAKSDFLSRMSHEFRTPLNVILGFSQLIISNKNEPLGKQQAENIDHIVKAGNHLLELINEILYLTKIEAGKLKLTMSEVSVSNTIDECIKLIKPLADTESIKISSNLKPYRNLFVEADPVRLREVLLNLLSNAVKYNRNNGSVNVECTIIDQDRVKISITDTGIGLTTEQQALLFKPFERIHADNSSKEGTGIGLLISQHLIEAMRGDIGFESQAGTGTIFWVELNIAAQAITSEPAKTTQSNKPQTSYLNSKEYTILGIDDNDSGLRLIEQLLNQRPSINIITTNSPEKGLEIANREIPDLILLDINMPNMNGYEVLKHLKANPDTKDIPVIAMSANAMPEDIAKGAQAAFEQYFTKPIDVDLFYDTIDSVLSSIH